MTNAQAAQQRAAKIYAGLVARGEQVVGRSAPASRTTMVVAEVMPAADDATASTADVKALDATTVKTPNRTRKPRA